MGQVELNAVLAVLTMKRINYTISVELGLIVEHYWGSITMDDIIALKKAISKQTHYSPKYDVIMDFRSAQLNFTVHEVGDYVRFANKFSNIVAKRKTGFITSRPKQVALTTIFGYIKGNLPIQSQTFSTLNALLVWFNKPLHSYCTIENILNDLHEKEKFS